MMAMTPSSVRKSISASTRAHPGRRQRGEDGDRMDVAFVQYAEHDVDRHQRGQDQERLVGERGLEGLGRSLEAALDARRQSQSVRGRSRSPSTASPSDTPGARLNEIVTAGNWPWRLMTSGPVVSVGLGDRAQRHLSAARAAEIDRLQPAGALLEVGLDRQERPGTGSAP